MQSKDPDDYKANSDFLLKIVSHLGVSTILSDQALPGRVDFRGLPPDVRLLERSSSVLRFPERSSLLSEMLCFAVDERNT